ncbi:metalloregulator ArsR/SmtB family transcription factor [Oscillochloris sp. ZM17-4]|uniref:ArsR/SmtB family transcription factor n=1 Tax=Oscillochloris sp. ZM17-4 TaxID=2866714 RepID=UPI001C72E685|nr:metalloregulator ArsR/SmtB family transcription factor [Oscillochloris sp. ZM17-4]MBX0330903.1 metalloregulator ArsR/SmtB family transcription factor [Oscillochloris sp. ZM17-4]
MNQGLEEEINQLHAEICQALSDPKRISILYELVDGRKNVGQLAVSLGLDQPTASRHLKVLRERLMVNTEREGSNIYYSIADRRVIEALDLLRAVLAANLAQRKNLADILS